LSVVEQGYRPGPAVLAGDSVTEVAAQVGRLKADAWDDQLMLVASNGHRAIAHDRRGHVRSSHPRTRQ
jgi:hypothetical protein